jgi:hypothetical protein
MIYSKDFFYTRKCLCIKRQQTREAKSESKRKKEKARKSLKMTKKRKI